MSEVLKLVHVLTESSEQKTAKFDLEDLDLAKL